MPISGMIDKLLAKPSVKAFFEDQSVFGSLVKIVGGITLVLGFLGKIFALDKTLAGWLSSALKTDATTHAPEFKTWFYPILVLMVLSWASLVLLALWTLLRRYTRTKDQIALDDIMGAVRQIRDQGKQQSGIKAWESVHILYLINKDFSGSVTTRRIAKAIDAPVHFLESVTSAEDEADPVMSLADIKFRVRSLSACSTDEVVYLPSENELRVKRACLFFLPPIAAGATREYETYFEWPGLFKKLKNNSEDFEFHSQTRDVLANFTIEVYLQEGASGSLDCKITGSQHPTQDLKPQKYQAPQWSGSGFIYNVTRIPAGDVQLALRIKVNR